MVLDVVLSGIGVSMSFSLFLDSPSGEMVGVLASRPSGLDVSWNFDSSFGRGLY